MNNEVSNSAIVGIKASQSPLDVRKMKNKGACCENVLREKIRNLSILVHIN
jgi:hypothetical protein